MRLIVGGAFQGKTEFALRLARQEDLSAGAGGAEGAGKGGRLLDGGTCTAQALAKLRGGDILTGFHLLVRRVLSGEVSFDACGPDGERDCDLLLERLLLAAKQEVCDPAGQLTILCDELGCGVVPVDPADRLWREKTGRLLCELAAQANEVYRVTAGVGSRIK